MVSSIDYKCVVLCFFSAFAANKCVLCSASCLKLLSSSPKLLKVRHCSYHPRIESEVVCLLYIWLSTSLVFLCFCLLFMTRTGKVASELNKLKSLRPELCPFVLRKILFCVLTVFASEFRSYQIR